MDAQTDADLDALRLSGITRVAGGFVAAAGFVGAVIVLQTVTSFRIRMPWLALIWAILPLGLAGILFGMKILGGRDWAAIGGLIVSLSLLLLDVLWSGYALLNAVFVPMYVIAVILALGASAATPFAIGECRRASAARRRLHASGFETGL